MTTVQGNPTPSASSAHPDPAGVGGLQSVAVFCGNCSCGCPELFLDPAADEERRVVLTDDFGQRVQMSLGQLSVLVADVKGGVLDHLMTSA
jgi:hypothetical protein